MENNVFELRNVSIEYKMKQYSLKAVDNVTLPIKEGKITALVGESGSGKTTLACSLLNCLTTPGVVTGGEVICCDDEPFDVIKLGRDELYSYRWSKVSMVFQGAQSSLNPLLTVKDHFIETFLVHNPKMPKKVAKEKAVEKAKELLEFVNLDYNRVLYMYPHELSGGMKQRIMIAFSLLLHPKLIILDEPTTALDVIVQNYIFKILQRINKEMGISMLLLTHDIAIVAQFADYVGVMYGGKLMEYGTTLEIFNEHLSPYTLGLINATPALDRDISTMESIEGTPPDIRNLPKGCVFNPRCKKCMEKCKEIEPKGVTINNHYVKCHLYEEGDK